MDYEVYARLDNQRIGIELKMPFEEDDKFCYYLCSSSGDTLSRSRWTAESVYSFDMGNLETGCYYVKVFVMRDEQKYVRKSSCFDYISQKDFKAFQQFCEQKMTYKDLNTAPFYLYHIKPPYSNFCLIHGEFQKENVIGFGMEYKFDTILVNQGSGNRAILIKESMIDFKKDGTILSGIGKVKEKLIVGNSNIDDSKTSADLSEEIGTFTYCKESNDGIVIGTDYFGLGKIYYYQDEESFVCGNNYHMLLLLLKKLGKKLQVNEEVVNALLCKMSQPFSQRFCRECEVKGIYILPVGRKIEIGREVEFTDTSIVQMWNMDRDITEEEYIELLKAGKEEILENTRAVLSCEYYDKILLELTGGLDSRITYAAVTSLGTKDKKVFINSIKTEEVPTDVELAAQVNSVYRLSWDNQPTVIKRYNYESRQKTINSHFLIGGYYFPLQRWPLTYDILSEMPESEERTITLNSFYGEICCRPYFSRNALMRYEDIEKYDIDRLIEVVVNQKDILSVKSYRALIQEMKKELDNLPGDSYIEKYELFYLFYRNSFHCSMVKKFERRGTWSILQSKNLYRLCRKMYYRKKDIKVQLDIINELNPILGCIPYTDERDNLSKKKLLNELYYPEETFRNITLELKNETAVADWEEACKVARDSTKYNYDDITPGGGMKEGEKQLKNNEEMLALLLHGIMQYRNGLFMNQFGIDVFCMKDKPELFGEELYNKLLSLHLQLRIIDDEYNMIFEGKRKNNSE